MALVLNLMRFSKLVLLDKINSVLADNLFS